MPDPTPTAARFTLRQLPLPAKLVITTFLLTVGVGYTSAMVQLHMQHSDRDGTTLPTVANVVAVFAGKVWKTADDAGEKVVSKLEAIISGDPKGGLSSQNMTPAFFGQDQANYNEIVRKTPARVPQLDAERHGERLAVIAWINAAEGTRKDAYEKDEFKLPADRAKQPITDSYTDKEKPGIVKIRSILRDRCVVCHKPGGEKGDTPLTTFAELDKFMPVTVAIPPGGGYVDSGKQMSLEKLTQSTHAHLLSFAVLFSLTGLVFAFSSYPAAVRGVVGPIVLVAQFADVACWWLARIPGSGPYFAMCIIGTGGVVGMGLGAQIVLSLFNMYGPKGKAVLAAMFLGAGVGGGLVWEGVVEPYLERLREAKRIKDEAANQAKQDRQTNPDGKMSPQTDGKGPGGNPVVPPSGPSGMERVLTGSWVKDGPWVKDGKVEAGGMVRAFFDKESDFKSALKDGDEDVLKTLIPEREGEQAAMLEWVRAAADVRKKAYEDDKFTLPNWNGRPLTAEFLADDKSVKVKTLIEARCLSCHDAGSKKPLDTFEAIEKLLKPGPGVAAVPPKLDKPAEAKPTAVVNAQPIPAATE